MSLVVIIIKLKFSQQSSQQQIKTITMTSVIKVLLLFITSLQLITGIQSPLDFDVKIFFPGQTQEVHLSSKTQSKCIGSLCEELENYPQEYIDKLVVQQPLVQEFLKADVGPEVQISDRGQFDMEETLCDSSVRTIAPKTGVNVNNQSRLIVQAETDKQLVTTEVCNERATCKFKEMFPNNYQVYCKQKFLKRRLFSINPAKSNETMFVDVYDIPCCCVCAIKKNNG